MFMPIFTKLRHLERELFVLSQKFPNNPRMYTTLVRNTSHTHCLLYQDSLDHSLSRSVGSFLLFLFTEKSGLQTGTKFTVTITCTIKIIQAINTNQDVSFLFTLVF